MSTWAATGPSVRPGCSGDGTAGDGPGADGRGAPCAPAPGIEPAAGSGQEADGEPAPGGAPDSEGGSVVRARPPGAGERRSRAVRPREPVGRRLVAREYRAAQEEGTDPVLAVMCATGYSRRGALRVIGRARDAGLLTPRHVRRPSE
ncbi:DUF6214 family protein [Streptomyces hirsutus]|uniref:DUF6214 family protein n=1 Tax=Streptomyces hirsutus TaxID=35620 RepID=UPI0033D8BC63